MKKVPLFWCVTAMLTGLLGLPELRAQTQTVTALIPDAQIIANQDSYKAWDLPKQVIGPNHRTTFRNTKTGQRQIVEVATGMNYWDGAKWSASSPSFVAVKDGFSAGQIQHQVHLAADLYGDNAVTVRTPEGILLNSTPLAIALFDAASGNFLVIATVTHCAPALVISNQVVYENAFQGVCASVVYTITADTFSQDVVITGQLNPADYGFPPKTTQIQIMTEFYGAPSPDRVRRPIFVEQDPKVRAAMAKPDLVDEQLGFGQFVLTTGKSFVAPSANNPNGVEATVTKEYRTLAGRTYLFESIPYVAIAKGLQALPPCQPATGSLNFNTTKGYAGIPRLDKKSPHGLGMLQARVSSGVHGVVIDYVANIGSPLNSTTVFKGDTTYLVSSAVTCNGAAIIEGGAVFKYKSGTSIILGSTLTCKTGMYRPAIFTAVDDDTVGDTMNGVTNSGYTGTISSAGYANPALSTTYALSFSNFRFRYAQTAIQVTDYSSTSWIVSHAQFIDCVQGVQIVAGGGCGCGCGCSYGCGIYSSFTFNNSLMSRVQYPITSLNSYGVSAQHNVYLYNFTVDRGTQFTSLSGYNTTVSIYPYNSIFANIPSMSGSVSYGSSISLYGGFNGFFNDGTTFGYTPYLVSTSPFQSVGAGGHYLTSASGFQNVGLASLPASLAADLMLRTTYPPLVTANTVLSTNQVLVPQVQRDTDTPDLGYHYDPLDYAFGSVYVTNAVMTVANGAVIATFGTNNSAYGLGFGRGSSLSSIGTPNNPNWFVLYNTVMENVGTNGNWQRPTNSVTGELYGATPAPSICTRFTSWSVLAQDASHFYAPTNSGPISFQDNEFHSGKLITSGPIINLTNCLLERVYVNLSSTDTNTPYIRNNLFLGGTFNFAPNVTNAFVKDNLFDQTVITNNASIYVTYNGGYNAFVTNNNRLLPTFGTDVILTNSPTYKAGPLGYYYQATNSGLVNVGHTNADQVGLYHYTVLTNLLGNVEIKETNSVVDIGYHYVAVGTNGLAADFSGDGLPDYLEDANGNGVVDSGEIGWNITGDLGLKVLIIRPRNGSYLP